MLKKSPEIPRPEEEFSPEEEKPLEFAREESSTAKSIEALKKMKELVEEWEKKEKLEELEKELLSGVGEINQTLGETRINQAKGKIDIDSDKIAKDVEQENFKVIKKDKLVSPETGKEININRIEFDLELKYPNQETETLRFISLEVPEEYRDLTKCHVYGEIIKNTKGKDGAPKLKERFDQKFITWQKEMMRKEDNPQRIKTNIPLEDSIKPSDIKRETLRRGMRTITLEENIVLVKMALRNGILEEGLHNKQKLEKFFGIEDLGSEQDNCCIRDFAFYTEQSEKKFGFLRGCPGWLSTKAGCFSLRWVYHPSFQHKMFGFRLAR